MIELLKDFPDDVLAVDCRGQIRKADYETVLLPALDAKLAHNETLRLFYRAGPAFEGIDVGAMMDDAKVGIAHWHKWKRAAIVTDIEWLRLATRLFGFLMPCPVRLFPVADEDEARQWLLS